MMKYNVCFESDNDNLPLLIEQNLNKNNDEIKNIYDYISLVTVACFESKEKNYTVTMNVNGLNKDSILTPLSVKNKKGELIVELPDCDKLCVNYHMTLQVNNFLQKMGIVSGNLKTNKEFSVSFSRERPNGRIERRYYTEGGVVKNEMPINSNPKNRTK